MQVSREAVAEGMACGSLGHGREAGNRYCQARLFVAFGIFSRNAWGGRSAMNGTSRAQLDLGKEDRLFKRFTRTIASAAIAIAIASAWYAWFVADTCENPTRDLALCVVPCLWPFGFRDCCECAQKLGPWIVVALAAQLLGVSVRDLIRFRAKSGGTDSVTSNSTMALGSSRFEMNGMSSAEVARVRDALTWIHEHYPTILPGREVSVTKESVSKSFGRTSAWSGEIKLDPSLFSRSDSDRQLTATLAHELMHDKPSSWIDRWMEGWNELRRGSAEHDFVARAGELIGEHRADEVNAGGHVDPYNGLWRVTFAPNGEPVLSPRDDVRTGLGKTDEVLPPWSTIRDSFLH